VEESASGERDRGLQWRSEGRERNHYSDLKHQLAKTGELMPENGHKDHRAPLATQTLLQNFTDSIK